MLGGSNQLASADFIRMQKILRGAAGRKITEEEHRELAKLCPGEPGAAEPPKLSQASTLGTPAYMESAPVPPTSTKLKDRSAGPAPKAGRRWRSARRSSKFRLWLLLLAMALAGVLGYIWVITR
jgi:hypothetical protein